MNTLAQQFNEEVVGFESLLAKQKVFNDKKINFIAQFHPTILVDNALKMHLVAFIDSYDQLLATLKLLRVAGCFISDDDYYANVQRIQKLTNQMLSRAMLMTRRVIS